jgi:sulfite reductase beta subunit-like hemoprotein
MYAYTDFDRQFVHARAAQFRDQLQRHLAGTLGEEEFRALRLQNGWYIQRHAPMLRIAVPYGELSSKQMRQLAHIARTHDRGYGHFTTRQNLQFNWIPLPQAADVMDLLAAVDMHGIQTSGNCVRNITSDALAGVAPDEVVDPRPYCEILRQWSTLHPEFAFLPRKFKIAVTGAREDRAAIGWHDIGLQLLKDDVGAVGFKVLVGGGMGRTPVIGTVVSDFVPWQQILVFVEAILRVYNRYGRRDNMYKARIKILVKAEGERFVQSVQRLPRRDLVAQARRAGTGRRHRRADGCGGGSGRSFQPRRVARHARPEPAAAVGAHQRPARAMGGGTQGQLRHAQHRLSHRHDRLPRRRLLCAGQCALGADRGGHHIGILGVDKDGAEWYQVTVGGSDGSTLSGASAPGKVIGPSFAADEVPDVIEALIDTYRAQRETNERFIDTARRIGVPAFRAAADAVRRSTAHAEAAA